MKELIKTTYEALGYQRNDLEIPCELMEKIDRLIMHQLEKYQGWEVFKKHPYFIILIIPEYTINGKEFFGAKFSYCLEELAKNF